ncbi:hypothetical protein B296_00050871 [Ensete ventricosum]|uniref:Uncharacterized protein n=1 Tax=Ensete ventricosum TaxID=4639 RepID=A0A426YEM2_ENSVE|nr:hypothetical protein B296_00050871 [Ensete ventricosum]
MNIFKKKTSPKDALRTSKREMAVATRGKFLVFRSFGCGTRDRFPAVRGLLFVYALHLNDLLCIILSVYCYLQASHQEKKLVAEIKKTAQTGNEASFSLYLFFMRGIAHCYLVHLLLQAATRILARQLVRLRQQITNLQGTRAQIRGIATHTQVRHSKLLDVVMEYHCLRIISQHVRKLIFGFLAGYVCKYFLIHRNERCKQSNGCYEQGLEI